VLPPTHPEADAGFVIMEHSEYPPMSGSNTICTATALLETGMIPMREPVTEFTLEAPAGLIRIRAEVTNSKVRSITFQNQPAFAFHLDVKVEVPTVGTLSVDVAYGGMIYVIADAESAGFRLTPDEGRDIARMGAMLIGSAQEQFPVAHPDNPRIMGPTIAQFSGPPTRPDAARKNAVVVPTGCIDLARPSSWTGSIDRSPCGTGTCAKMAVLHAKGRLGLNQDFKHESIIGTLFTGRLISETRVGSYPAVIPTITGTGWIYAITQYVLDAEDPFPEGFTVGDIWAA
jgi:proline racemase